MCKCANGTPQGGSGCTTHDANMCKECNTGWAISKDKTKCEGSDCNPIRDPRRVDWEGVGVGL